MNAPAPGRFLPLDGLRGLAILLVLLLHLLNHGPLRGLFALGWTGVDLFFVLSGFLITGILLDHRGAPGAYRRFLRNRALRTLPLYYGVLLAFALVSGYATPTRWFAHYGGYFWTHTSNLLLLQNIPCRPLGHFWSLALEEQFYLLWPLLVLYAGRRTLVVVSLLLLAFGLWLRAAYPSSVLTYGLPFAHLDGLLTGSGIALFFRTHRPLLLRYSGVVLAVASLALLSALAYCYAAEPGAVARRFHRMPLALTLVALFWGALLVALLRYQTLQTLFSQRALRFFGKYSYGMYVFNSIFFYYATWAGAGRLSGTGQLLAYAGVFVLTIGCSVASYHLFEARFLRWKRPMRAAVRA